MVRKQKVTCAYCSCQMWTSVSNKTAVIINDFVAGHRADSLFFVDKTILTCPCQWHQFLGPAFFCARLQDQQFPGLAFY